MSGNLDRLREDLAVAAQIEDLGDRVLEILGIVEEAVEPLGLRPVLVGGMAVFLWTGREDFVTVDVDVVVPTTRGLSDTLGDLGFIRDGRHWVLEAAKLFLEAPSSELDRNSETNVIESPSGREVVILSLVDVLLTRVAEFQATGHRIAGEQSLALLSSLRPDDEEALVERAEERKLTVAVHGLRVLADEISRGQRQEPDTDEWHEIARLFQARQYR